LTTVRLCLVLSLVFIVSSSASVWAQTSDGSSQDDAKAPDKKPSTKKVATKTESVIVTGTYAPVPVEDIDRSVSIADVRGNSNLYQHWIDLLAINPSVDIQQRSPDDVQADLSIRGSTFEQTLVLLNGLRMNDVQTSHHDLDLPLPTESLERIEVLRGAGSAFYGSDAVGGTVNFITGPPEYSEVRVGAGLGNFGVNQEALSAALLTNRVDERVTVARDFSSGFMPDRDYRSLTIFSNTGVRSPWGRTLLMLGYGDKPFGANDFYGDFPSWERTKSWFAGLKQDLAKQTEFDFGYHRHSDEYVLFRDNPAFYENNHIDESWQAAVRRSWALSQNSTLFYGGEGFHESIASNNLGDHQRSRGAVYADYDVRTLGRLSLSLAGREEIFDTGTAEFSPTIAAGIWLKAGWKLKASVSRAFRLPTYTDLYYHDPATIGNPSLQPERAWGYEGGLLWDSGSRYRAEVTVFERQERNDIDYVRASPEDPWLATNIGRLNFIGAETSFEMRLAHQQEVTIICTGIYGAQNALNGLQSQYVFNYPVADGSVNWHGLLPGRIETRTRIAVTRRYARDPYALWDLSVAREFPHIATHLALANLTNTQYQEIEGVAMPGRSVVFGIDLFWAKKKMPAAD
jgi:outer membrane cobalamin receptor